MSERNVLSERLSDLPEPPPLYLRRARLDVTYSAAFARDESYPDHRRTVDDAARELQVALRLGFFAWACFPARAAATLKTDWKSPGRLGLVLTSDGTHHNVLTALLRFVLGLHHTPREGRAELLRILGDDAASLSPPTVFTEAVERIDISGLEGLDERRAATRDWTVYAQDGEIAAPAGAENLSQADERIVVHAPGLSGFPSAALGRIENRFLQISGTGLFHGPERMDEYFTAEPSIFVRDKKTSHAAIVIDEYPEEEYGLLELLNVLSDGRIASLVVATEYERGSA